MVRWSRLLLIYFSSFFRKKIRLTDTSDLSFIVWPQEADKKYIRLLDHEKNITARFLAKKLGCNIDHARRILRMFYRMKIVKRNGDGTKYSPYVYCRL